MVCPSGVGATLPATTIGEESWRPSVAKRILTQQLRGKCGNLSKTDTRQLVGEELNTPHFPPG